MTTAVSTEGMQYVIPESDLVFFKTIADKMGWIAKKVNIPTDTDSMAQKATNAKDADSLSDLKGMFSPMYPTRDEMRNDYLSDKFGV